MMSIVAIGVGVSFILLSVVLFAKDCRGQVSPSMGGEMTFSSLWLIGVLLAAVGVLLYLSYSLLLILLLVPVLFLLSFPIRTAIAHVICVPYVPPPTGFQTFVRRVEGKEKGQLRQ